MDVNSVVVAHLHDANLGMNRPFLFSRSLALRTIRLRWQILFAQRLLYWVFLFPPPPTKTFIPASKALKKKLPFEYFQTRWTLQPYNCARVQPSRKRRHSLWFTVGGDSCSLWQRLIFGNLRSRRSIRSLLVIQFEHKNKWTDVVHLAKYSSTLHEWHLMCHQRRHVAVARIKAVLGRPRCIRPIFLR